MKHECHHACGWWYSLIVSSSPLRHSAVEPTSAQHSRMPLSQGVECEMKPTYLPSLSVYLGSLNLQVKETKT